jgi:hypothetical protein
MVTSKYLVFILLIITIKYIFHPEKVYDFFISGYNDARWSVIASATRNGL